MTQPYQRPSYRYMKIKIHSEASVEFEELLEEYWETIPEYIGLKQFSDTDAWLIKNKFDYTSQEVVLRVDSRYETDFETALTLVKEIDGEEAFLQVVEVSGSISVL